MKLHSKILALTTCLLALAVPTPVFAAKGANQGAKRKAVDPAEKAARPGQLLKKYDTDKDGSIDGTEVAALRTAFEADKTGPLKKLDTNNDGTLEDSEVAAIKARHGKGKGSARKAGKKKKA